MRLGFMHHLLGCDKLDAVFARAAKLGIAGLELTYGTSELAWLDDDDHAKQIKALSRQHKVAVPSVCASFVCDKPSLIDPPGQISKAQELLEKLFAVARTVGAKVVLVPFFGSSAIEVEDELTLAIDSLLELVEPAQEAGVVMGVESTLNLNQQEFLLGHFAHTENVKLYYDTGNALARKFDLPTGIRQLGPTAIAGIHFKDVKIAPPEPPDFAVPMGGGHVNFAAVVQALRAIGYDGWVILETPPLEDPVKQAEANIKLAQELLARNR